MEKNEQNYIHPDQLCVGLYIHLDLSWMQHPFALSSFKIKDENQIRTLQEMALERIRYEPLRSDVAPLPLVGQSEEPAKPERKGPSARGGGSNANVKKQRITESIRACESKFVRVTDTARKVVNDFSSSPQAAAEATVEFVDGVVNEILSSGEVIIQAMDGGRLGDETYFHPLNVAVLSLMMAKSLGLSAEDANLLGVAALLHDIGMAGMPNTILMNSGPLSKAEKSILQGHCQAGAEMAKAAGLPERVASIILQHHECVDGSGYPQGLKGDEIDPLAKVLGLVNAYEALCNPPNYEEAMTPYGALSHLFANERKKYDGPILNLMIKSLGVYPPGSVVQLSDGVYGTVLQVNPQKLLRPFIMLHDKRTERDSPNILDLGDEADTTISKCLRADQLPPEAAEYLQCRKKLSYYFTIEGQLLNNDGGDS